MSETKPKFVIIKYALIKKIQTEKIHVLDTDNDFLVLNKCQHIRDVEKTLPYYFFKTSEFLVREI